MRMYKLLIVEDEIIEREALMEFVDWPSLGVELAGSAESAEEALNLSLTDRFDILLTDIRLLGMSGLELARTLLRRQPRLKVIINSGYSDFEYARQAVEMRACSFITKPIDIAELKAVVARVVGELDEEREQAGSSERLRQLVQENLPLIRRHFFERLVAGSLPDAEIVKSVGYFALDAVQGRFAVLLCELDGFDALAAGADWEGLQMALEAVRDAVLEGSPEGLLDFYYIDRGRFAALLGIDAAERKNEPRFIFSAAERIRGQAAEASGGSVTVGMGPAVGSIKDIRQSFRAAETALALKFAAGPGQVISHADAALCGPEPGRVDLDAIEGALALAVETANAPEAGACLERLFAAAARRGWDERRAAAACIRLLSRLLLLLRDLGEPDEKVFENGALWGRLLGCRSLKEMGELMHKCVSGAAGQLMERRADADRNVVRHILDYIDRNLENRITAADLADEFYYSPNYIGVVFKKDTGKTLTEHLKDVRLERARELLKNPASRIGEVAKKVGYPNVSYFCAMFKKKYGVNPGEYKENA
jgi:two-component system response regulator YesN